MKRSIARKWAQALESGEYKQVKGTLRKGDKFCCLGVLCNLHAQEHPEMAAQQKYKRRYLGETSELPIEVRGWAGMSSNYGYVTLATTLVGLNDHQGKTFPEIAKVIRKHWKEL